MEKKCYGVLKSTDECMLKPYSGFKNTLTYFEALDVFYCMDDVQRINLNIIKFRQLKDECHKIIILNLVLFKYNYLNQTDL